MTVDDRDRLAVLLALQTVAVAVLAAVTAQLVGFPQMDLALSGPFAVLAYWLVAGTLVGLVVAYVAIPAVLSIAYARERTGGLVYFQVWALFAVLVLPLVAIGSLRLLTWRSPWAILVAAAVGVAIAILAVHHEGADSTADSTVPWPMFLNVALLVLFVVAFLWVSPIAAGYADAHTSSQYGGPPGVSFDFDQRETDEGDAVVTITHDGWKPVDADAVELSGRGFTDGPDVDQTEPGTWQGETTRRDGRGSPEVIEPGDSVTIGVEGECYVVVRLTYVDHGNLGGHVCEAAR